MNDDVFGTALLDFYEERPTGTLWVHNKYGKKEKMPIGMYFRTLYDMPELELIALDACKGRVLEVGAGAGSHALYLESLGFDVSALDSSPGACELMLKRGLSKVHRGDFFNTSLKGYDTMLLLMNGIGLAGNLERLKQFLQVSQQCLNHDGQILFDSSDVSYLFENKPMPSASYYGELEFQYEYRSQKSDWFQWLYIDQQKLQSIASALGWTCQIIFEDEDDQFLAKLTRT